MRSGRRGDLPWVALADEDASGDAFQGDFAAGKAVFFGQADGLATTVFEDLGGDAHGVMDTMW